MHIMWSVENEGIFSKTGQKSAKLTILLQFIFKLNLPVYIQHCLNVKIYPEELTFCHKQRGLRNIHKKSIFFVSFFNTKIQRYHTSPPQISSFTLEPKWEEKGEENKFLKLSGTEEVKSCHDVHTFLLSDVWPFQGSPEPQAPSEGHVKMLISFSTESQHADKTISKCNNNYSRASSCRISVNSPAKRSLLHWSRINREVTMVLLRFYPSLW